MSSQNNMAKENYPYKIIQSGYALSSPHKIFKSCITLMHVVLLKRKMIGLCMPLVNLEQNNLLIMIMKFLYLMLKLNLVVNTHLMIMKKIMMRFSKTLKQIIKNHTMMLRQNQSLILITHNLRIKDMTKESLFQKTQ